MERACYGERVRGTPVPDGRPAGEGEGVSYSWSEVAGLTISGFYGGTDRGMCLQFTIDRESCALTADDVRTLIADLQRWFTEKYEP